MSNITLSLPDTLYHQLDAMARQEKVSLAEYMLYALTRYASSAYLVQEVSEPEKEKQRQEFDALLERLRNGSNASEEEMDRALNEHEAGGWQPQLMLETAAQPQIMIEQKESSKASSS